MKKIICMSVIICLVMMLTVGCGGIKYCKVEGCPSEVLMDEKYCAEHKCDNFSCGNRATVSFGYCEECLEAAND